MSVSMETSQRKVLVSGEIGGELFCFALEAFALVADGEGGAGLGELLGDAPGDAALVGEAEDDGYFAFEIDHDASAPVCFPLVRIAAWGGRWCCLPLGYPLGSIGVNCFESMSWMIAWLQNLSF